MKYSFAKSCALFLSKIIVKKLTADAKVQFRIVEKLCRKHVKLKADISFLEFCIDNQISRQSVGPFRSD